jgi:DNA-binding Xre family transcriptional regulator
MLEKVISNSGFKKSHIAEQMGINAYTLTLKIKNEREFKATEIDALCKILNIDVSSRMKIFFAH